MFRYLQMYKVASTNWNIAEGTTDPRVEFILPKLPLKVISQVQTQIITHFIFRISTKHQLKIQNLGQTQLQNLDQDLKSYLKIKYNIMTKPCAQSLNKNLTSLPNLTFRICTKLLPTRFSSSTSATLTTPTSIELSSSHARVKAIKFTKQELGSY